MFELNHLEDILDAGNEFDDEEEVVEHVPRAISNGDVGSIRAETCPARPHWPVLAQKPHPGFAIHVEQLAISHGINVHDPTIPLVV